MCVCVCVCQRLTTRLVSRRWIVFLRLHTNSSGFCWTNAWFASWKNLWIKTLESHVCVCVCVSLWFRCLKVSCFRRFVLIYLVVFLLLASVCPFQYISRPSQMFISFPNRFSLSNSFVFHCLLSFHQWSTIVVAGFFCFKVFLTKFKVSHSGEQGYQHHHHQRDYEG